MPVMTLEELFYKYLDENITPDELRLFREMATREENRAELDRLFAEWMEQDLPFAEPEVIDIEAMYFELTRKKNIPVADGQVPVADGRRVFRNFFSLRGAVLAAACLLLVFSLFLLRRPAAVAVRPFAKAPVISPAGNRATLTLADGRRIVLDSAANGNLAVQGNSQVVKLAGGQVVYRDGAGGSGGNGGGEKGAGGSLAYNIMTTPRGGYYQIVLPDGSKVWLDAASSLRYPTAFTGTERLVELTGEAYFEIAPNVNQPFLVSSNGVTVQVLGTEFNMMAYSDEDAIRTTLVKGSVRVVCGNGHEQIRPGQQASWMRSGGALQLSTPDMAGVLAWKLGQFRFQGLPISAIMRQVARWYDVDVEFRGTQPATEFNGVISRKKEVAELLAVLQETEDVHFTLQGRRIIVEAIGH
jgi:transmembrane sensor